MASPSDEPTKMSAALPLMLLAEHGKTNAGYLHFVDLEVRDDTQAAAAWTALLALWPDAKSAPYKVSGTESRHLYFFTDRPMPSRTLARSRGFAWASDSEKGCDVRRFDWELTLLGVPKPAMLSRSLHPNTGEPCEWGREINWTLVELDLHPTMPNKIIEAWTAIDHGDLNIDSDDLVTLARTPSREMNEPRIALAIANLPREWVCDRSRIIQVGAALHHAYDGGGDGFKRWAEWCKSSPDFDIADQDLVWDAFEIQTLYQGLRTENPRSTFPLYNIKKPGQKAKLRRLTRQHLTRHHQVKEEVMAARLELWLNTPIESEPGIGTLEDSKPRYRETVCLAQVWAEMLGVDGRTVSCAEEQRLGRALRKVGWMQSGTTRFPTYGKQRAYWRTSR